MRTFEDSYRSKAFWSLTVLALVTGFFMLIPFIPALLWATVLSVLVQPMYARFQRRMPASAAAGLATFATILMIGVPLVLIGMALFVQVSGFVAEMSSAAPAGQNAFSMENVIAQIDQGIRPVTQALSPSFSFATWFEQNREQLTRSLQAPLGKLLYSAGYTLFTLVVAFLTMFFMLRDGHRLVDPAVELLPLPRDKSLRIFQRTADTIRAVFIGVVLVALIQGLLAGIAYVVVGVPNAVMWGVATVVLCTIPLLGAPIVYIPLSLILAIQGKPVQAVGLALFGFIVISNIDNLLRPFIIGARVELHPMAIFFSLLGGVLLLGPVGIMAGPMLLTILLMVQDIVREQRQSCMEDDASGAPGDTDSGEASPEMA